MIRIRRGKFARRTANAFFFRTLLLLISLWLVLICSPVGSAITFAAPHPALTRSVPRGVNDLRQIQTAVRRHLDELMACTVGVQVGPAHASGVVVTADGYVMTAAHVVGRPGLAAKILFADGRTAKGKTLGFNADIDGGLIKITEPGPWPFAPVVDSSSAPERGDWCLALGHPGGFRTERSPPVRLGRVVLANSYVIHSDCAISEGDSGGPLFDLQGRVIGVHSRIAEEITVNLHVPALALEAFWDRLKAGEVYPQSRFLDSFDTNKDGQIVIDEIPEGTYRRVYDRLADRFGFDATEAQPIGELQNLIGWYTRPRTQFELRRAFRPFRLTGTAAEKALPLATERFVRGRSVMSAFRGLLTDVYKTTVEVHSGGKKIALGTIVDADGLVITKASQLDGGKLTCRLADGRDIPSQLVKTDTEHDLALLRVRAGRLAAVEFETAPEPRVGDWVISSGPTRGPVSIGVVSVAARKIARSPAVLGVRIDPDNDGSGAFVMDVVANLGAHRAGIRSNDLITEVEGRQIANFPQLLETLRNFRVGQSIKVTILRGEKVMVFSIRLSERQGLFESDQSTVHGRRSVRRDDFPFVIQHDSVLEPTDCGGPVVDVSGRLVGINIARGERTASYAVPVDTVAAVVKKLIGGELVP